MFLYVIHVGSTWCCDENYFPIHVKYAFSVFFTVTTHNVQCLFVIFVNLLTFQHSLDVELSVSAAAAEQADLGESSKFLPQWSCNDVAVSSWCSQLAPAIKFGGALAVSLVGLTPTRPFIKHTQMSYVGKAPVPQQLSIQICTSPHPHTLAVFTLRVYASLHRRLLFQEFVCILICCF